jgi:hypothetical protein
MISSCGTGYDVSWILMVMITLMFAAFFFMMKRMRGKGSGMDCCTSGKSGMEVPRLQERNAQQR